MRQRPIVYAAVVLAGALVVGLLSRSTRPDEDGRRSPPTEDAPREQRLVAPRSGGEIVPAREVLEPGPSLRPLEAGASASTPMWFVGRIVDETSGAPIAGAFVGFADASVDDRTATTDASGVFRWSLRKQREALPVSAAGYAHAQVWAGATSDGAAPVEIRLLRLAALVARLAAPRDGLRLRVHTSGEARHVSEDGRSLPLQRQVEVPFAADGRARLDALVPRIPLRLEVFGPRGLVRALPDPVVLEPGECRSIEIPSDGVRLSVRCLDQNERPVASLGLLLTRSPQAAAAVERQISCYLTDGDAAASFANARTDEDGRAEFEGVPAGEWWIGPPRPDLAGLDLPRAPEEALAPLATAFELTDAERERELVLHVERGRYLRGRLVDPAGAPVSRAFVGAEHATLGGFVTGDVADDGTFALGPVAAGVHLVRAIPHGTFVAPEPVRAEPDGPEIVIELRPGAALAGHVVDARTGAPARADVVCSRPSADFAPHGSIGDDGRFAFSGLEAGTYAVAARTADGRAGLARGLTLAPGARLDDVRVELAPAAHLALRRTHGPKQVTLELRLDEAVLANDTLDAGVERQWFVPAGRVTVTLSSADTTLAERIVDARAGERCEVVFELE